jgi:hypothetical protein
MNFDPDFAGPVDYARAYRSLGIQVVPGHSPLTDSKNWKRPAIPWREFEGTLVPDTQFDEWFGQGARFASCTNIGMVTGSASGGLFILDADIQKVPLAETWLAAVKDRVTDGKDFSTPCQRTGGAACSTSSRPQPAGRRPRASRASVSMSGVRAALRYSRPASTSRGAPTNGSPVGPRGSSPSRKPRRASVRPSRSSCRRSRR